ncbi:MAG TPA: hypothetical protein VEB42_13595 [Chitinophagaceae bacterium]|nr:hypothetical protein [Chitinophagaceae bacterium]
MHRNGDDLEIVGVLVTGIPVSFRKPFQVAVYHARVPACGVPEMHQHNLIHVREGDALYGVCLQMHDKGGSFAS